MTDYYVGSGGSDGAAGTSYALRWATIGKALGASGIASGDRVFIAPGTYREVVTVFMTSATVDTKIIGDVDGSHTSGVPGEVVWTGYTTNDTTAPSVLSVVNLNDRDFLSFSNLTMVGGGPGTIAGGVAASTNINFVDCLIHGDNGSNNSAIVAVAAGVNAAWLFDRCTFIVAPRNVAAAFISVTLARHTADYDCGVVARNCVFIGGGTACIRVASSGSGSGFGGGVVANACTFFGTAAMVTADANLSTSIPCRVNNSWIHCGTGLNANTSGQIVESYNAMHCNTQRTNVSTGTGSTTVNVAPRFHLGQERLYGGTPRSWFTPSPSSPLLGWGAGASPPSVDLLNRDRPAGGASTSITAGAFERHDFGTKETTTTDAGGVALKLTGPGDHDLLIPVDAVSTTISVKVYYDTNHATTNKPQAQLLANGEIGYAGQTVTATVGTATWDTLTFSGFTPSAKGVVTLRLRSRSAAGNGYAIFDTVSIT